MSWGEGAGWDGQDGALGGRGVMAAGEMEGEKWDDGMGGGTGWGPWDWELGEGMQDEGAGCSHGTRQWDRVCSLWDAAGRGQAGAMARSTILGRGRMGPCCTVCHRDGTKAHSRALGTPEWDCNTHWEATVPHGRAQEGCGGCWGGNVLYRVLPEWAGECLTVGRARVPQRAREGPTGEPHGQAGCCWEDKHCPQPTPPPPAPSP